MPMDRGINLFESDIDTQDDEVNINEWIDVEFDVALDSGSIVHVCRDSDTPGYEVQESAGSRRGQNFLVGNGGKMLNLGEKKLSLEVDRGDSSGMIASVFQIAQVTRPLMSVGKICDEGYSVIFSNEEAEVLEKTGNVKCVFHRNNGCLYISET